MRLTLSRPSIARRLFVALLLAYVLMWLVAVAIAASGLYSTGSGDFDREMTGVAQVIDTIAADPSLPLEAVLQGLALKLAEDGRRASVPGAHLGFQVHDGSGALIAQGGADAPTLAEDTVRGFFEFEAGDRSWRVLRQVSANGTRRIDVTQALEVRARIMHAVLLNKLTLVQLLIGFPFLCLPIWLAVRTGLAPLLRLSQALSARQPGELEPIRMDLPYRELVPLIDALNATLSRLSELLHRERAFLADAAHELRTPLAVISAQYDTLRKAPNGDQREEAMLRLSLGVARSVRLVNQLLALARLEADVEGRQSHFNLADLIRDCLTMHASAAAERGIELSYHGCDSLVTYCPAHAVEMIVHNLVSNAIRHGRAGGQVEVVLATNGDDEYLISVSDDGPGISVEEHQHVFERFWRGTASAVQTPGSGLGMAIVLAASRQLGGRIELEVGVKGEGLKVALTWQRLRGNLPSNRSDAAPTQATPT